MENTENNVPETIAPTEPDTKEKRLLLRNDSPMTKETIKTFFRNTKISGLIFLFLGILSFALGLFEPHWLYAELDTLLMGSGIILVVCGMLLLFIVHNNVKNSLLGNETHNRFFFYDDEIVCFGYDGEKKRDEAHITYSQLKKVYQEGNLYVIQFGGLAWLLDKSKFLLGNEEDFRTLMREKCGKRVMKIKEEKR